jgi:acetylglutamate kinase
MSLTVIKIGGNIIDDTDKLAAFLQDFAKVEGHKILVHGGGKIASDIGKKLGIEPNYVDGRRITDAPTLNLVTMVYGGLINKKMVAALQSYCCNAIGLTGADGGILPAVKRPVDDIDYGFVGDVQSDKINGALIYKLLESGLTPVFAPLTYDVRGSLLNTNADTIAQEIAQALSHFTQVQLIYCFEKKGVLVDPEDDTTIITSIIAKDFEELKEKGIITGGMLPKLENAFAAIGKGVSKVTIGDANDLQCLITGNSGTCIR